MPLPRSETLPRVSDSSAARYRVLVADCSPMFRRGLIGLLEDRPELRVVGEVCDARELVRLARQLRPSVAVVDAAIAGQAEDSIRDLLRQLPDVAVLLLSQTGSIVEATRALAAGTCGYVLKEAEPELLVTAIIAAAQGYAVSPRQVMLEIGRASNPLNGHRQLLDGLSPREYEVLRDLADGMTTRMLADRLDISEKTVRNHIASMYEKLGMHDRAQLVRYAIQKGLSRPLEAARPPRPAAFS